MRESFFSGGGSRGRYHENGIMSSAKKQAKTMVTTHVVGNPASSETLSGRNCTSTRDTQERRRKSRPYRNQRTRDKHTKQSGVTNELEEEFIPSESHHPAYPRTKVICLFCMSVSTVVRGKSGHATHFIHTPA